MDRRGAPLVDAGTRRSSRVCLIDGDRDRSWTYAELFAQVAELCEAVQAPVKKLVFCVADTSFGTVRGYLGALEAGHAVALFERMVETQRLAALIDLYRPDYVLASAGVPDPDYRSHPQVGALWVRNRPAAHPIHPDLALLLSTSGSTGSPKFVRLSLDNLRCNAAAIAEYLEITPEERAIASLPLSYSYGLSVLNSHLHAGGSVVLTSESILQREFWQKFDAQRCTSFAGVPYTYEILERTGMLRVARPSLRTLTQAGGRMRPELVMTLHELMVERGCRLFVMYGQTEATARIAYVPPAVLGAHPDAIGVPIPGGRLQLERDGSVITAPREVGELVYFGPNVMLGYASSPADLARGDDLGGRLATGDLGYVDESGYYRVTGRLKRILKLFGRRISLDEVEQDVRTKWGGHAAVVGRDDRMVIFFEGEGDVQAAATRRQALGEQYSLHVSVIEIRFLPSLPVTPNGKPDYRVLQEKL
jgi:long-chain acyl-CoA synthetase